jgi:alkyl sulfatase BDS1-like metallo-beta-lactamase superfamily hydrolase
VGNQRLDGVDVTGGIYRERPGAADLAPATGEPATALGQDIWVSPGVSNAYAVGTDDGRVIINTGLVFEGPLRKQAFDATCPGPTRTIIVTQGHPDHWGGVTSLREPGTEVIMHSNYRQWRDDTDRLMQFRMRNTAFGFGHIATALAENLKTMDLSAIDMSYPEPTLTFTDTLELEVGGRKLVMLATPGGETTDALVVWMPEDRVLFTGNLFGPLFGVVPNLSTIRGDRYRDPLQYIDACNKVLSLGPKRVITGHFDPIEGADRITEEVTVMRDAMQWVHDRTVEGMEAGKDVHTLMGEIRVPEHLDVGQGYGKTSWNVRATWEMYAGWFHHRATTELYHVAPVAIAGDLVAAAGADQLVGTARTHLDGGRPLHALHLIELVLSVDADNSAARAVAIEAHEQLLASAENYWEKAWLTKSINELRATP